MEASTTNYKATTRASEARAILERKIESGRSSAVDLFHRIHQDAPHDAIVRGSAFRFHGDSDRLSVEFGGDDFGVHNHALGQFASRAGIPGQYLRKLSEAGGWQRDLAAEVLSKHYHNGAADQRFLARAVNGNVRGLLSDKYRRLDSRPLVDAFASECQAVGAVPVDGTCSDTRVALKAIVPQIYEPVPGEVIAFGLEWANSDFGHGMHALRAFILRVWCLNGATMENALAQVHIGGRIAEDIEFSQRTYELDTRASISALRDVVRGTLSAPKVEQLCDGIRRADENKVEWKNVRSSLAKRLLKGELDAAKAAFESEDVINLPAGKSMWRVSNALSWIAGQTEDRDRKLDLQRLAGEVVSGKREAEIAA